MSLAFVPQHGKEGVSTVQRLLDENSRLIEDIREQQNLGRADEVLKRQQLLHRNLVYLAKLADQSLLAQLQTDNEARTPQHPSELPAQECQPTGAGPSQNIHTRHMQSPPQVPQLQVPPHTSPGAQMMPTGQMSSQTGYVGMHGQPSPVPQYSQPGHQHLLSQQLQTQPGVSQAASHPGTQVPHSMAHPGQMPTHTMGHPGLTMGQPPPMQTVNQAASQASQMPLQHYSPQQGPATSIPSSQAGYPGMSPMQHMMHQQHAQMGQPHPQQHMAAHGMPPGYPPGYEQMQIMQQQQAAAAAAQAQQQQQQQFMR